MVKYFDMKNLKKLTISLLIALMILFVPCLAVHADDEPVADPAADPTAPSVPTIDSIAGEVVESVPTVEEEAVSLWPATPEIESGTGYMMEINTGAVLYNKSADSQRYPASTTKLMTALLALERCSLNETITFSENAVTLEDGASSINAIAGEQMSMKDCLYGLMLPSGNDCANAIAEHIAGSVEAFAQLMNEKAEELGCSGTHFTNPHGLFDANHYTTAADLCKIAQAAFNNSAFIEIISHTSYTIPATNKSAEREVENTHYMISPTSSFYNDTVIGGKTGNLPESGRCLVSLARHNGMSVIVVILYSPSYNGVFSDTQELLDYAFNGFTQTNVSEIENRFNFSCEEAKISLDSSSQIIIPQNLTLNDLDSDITFSYDLDLEDFNEATEKAGITSQDGRHLYAVINYSCSGNYLGHLNVLLDDNLKTSKISYQSVQFINTWVFLAAAVLLLFLCIFLLILVNRLIAERKKIRNPYARRI